MKKENIPILVSVLVLIFFIFYFISIGNYEFLGYATTIAILLFLIYKTDKIFHYTNLAKYGFALWLFSHFAGGGFKIGETRLYDSILINLVGEPLNILRYDQLIHGFCYFVIALFVYSIVLYNTKDKSKTKWIAFITIITAIGIGAINEIIEFFMVIFLNAGKEVGNYYNNALDLVFNAVGATLAVLLVNKKKK